MIHIRHNIFETNSSSCHVFVYDPKGSAQVQKTVTLVPDSDDSMLNILFNDYYCWYRPEREFEDDYLGRFLNNLLAIGVRTVKCSDENVVKLFELYKERGNYHCYNKNGLILSILNLNSGSYENSNSKGLSYSYDENGRLTRIFGPNTDIKFESDSQFFKIIMSYNCKMTLYFDKDYDIVKVNSYHQNYASYSTDYTIEKQNNHITTFYGYYYSSYYSHAYYKYVLTYKDDTYLTNVNMYQCSSYSVSGQIPSYSSNTWYRQFKYSNINKVTNVNDNNQGNRNYGYDKNGNITTNI